MGVVYKITNLINNKVYIGKTTNSIKQRFNEHVRDSKYKESKEYNYVLHKAIRKYGEKNFNIVEIEKTTDEKLSEREQYWIKFYNSMIPNGYNMTLGGEGALKYDRKEIQQKWENGWSRSEIQSFYHINKVTLRKILKECDSYTIKEVKSRDNLTKKVYQYNSKGELINIFNSIQEAADFVSVDRSCISRCCSKQKDSIKGFVWSFTPLNFTDKEVRVWKKIKVVQLDLKDNIINIFETLTDAGKSLNKKNCSYIKECCQGKRKEMYGYKWKFFEDVDSNKINKYVDKLAVKAKENCNGEKR